MEKMVRLSATEEFTSVNALFAEIERLKAALAESENRVNFLQRNNSERTKNQDELEFQRQVLVTQREASPDGILIVDEHDKIISHNQHFINLWQIPDEVMQLGRDESLLDFVTNQISKPDAFVARIKWLYEHKEASSEDEILLKNGRIIQRITAPIVGTNAQYLGRVWYFREITDLRNAMETLAHQKANLDEAQRIAKVGSWELDLTSNILIWSDEIFRIFEVDPAQFGASYEAFIEVVHPDDRDAVNAAYFSSITDSASNKIEHRLLMADGRIKHVQEQYETFHDASGKPLRSVGMVQDITERKQIEAQLQASHELLTKLTENISGFVYQFKMSPEGSFTMPFAGGAIEECFGVTAEEISNDDSLLFKAVHADDLGGLMASIHESARTLQPWNHEFRTHPLPEETKWLIGTSKPEKHEDGSIVWHGFITDITERKKKDGESLFLSNLVELSDLPMFALDVDDDYRMVFANQAVCSHLGRTRDELLKMRVPDWDLIMTYDMLSQYRVFSMQNNPRSFETVHQRSDGSTMPVEIFTSNMAFDGRNFTMGYVRNITERKRTERDLLVLNAALNRLSDSAFLADEKFRFVYVNDAACRNLGYTREELATMTFADIDPDLDLETLQKMATLFAEGGEHPSFERRHRTKDGRVFPVDVSVTMIEHDGVKYGLTLCRDISERKRTEHELLVITTALNNLSEAALLMDEQYHFVYVNDAACRNLGYTREELGKMTPLDIDPDIDSDELHNMFTLFAEMGSQHIYERRHRARNGHVYPVEITLTMIEYDGVKYGLTLCRDISERRKHETELLHFASHDAVTGLPNRRLLTDRLEQAVVRAQRNGKILAVCYLDVDNFKPINDEFGHAVGDQLLRTVAEKLSVVLREEDTLARLGGDEFVLLFNQLEQVEDVHAILDRLLKEICTPTMIENNRLTLSASIGVALYPQDDVDAETLLRHADQAMYKAKNAGKNRYYLYDPSHDLKMQERLVNIQQLRLALERGEFVLHYQPKVNLLNGSVVGAEALIRWQHPERGLLSPAAFLEYIDGDDLESEVGEWVIRSALKQIEAWNAIGLSFHVSVNVSAGQLLNKNFAEHLSAMLEQHPNVVSSDLGLEIIETAALTDMSQAFNALQRCKELGVRISLDDFGTGHSSLTHLRQLPVDTLKIDQTFVRDMLTDPSDHGIVLSVVQLAHTFNHEVIAEGVETLEQGAALIKLGCRVMQGYGIARPMPARQMLDWVNEWHRDAIWQKLNI